MQVVRRSSPAALFAAVALCGPVCAQGLEGPLAGPSGVSSGPVAAKHSPANHANSAKHVNPKVKTSRAEMPTDPRSAPRDLPAREIAATPKAPPPPPVTFGMKWSGSNESGRETRFDNLNGNYAGTGGTVGLKLPF